MIAPAITQASSTESSRQTCKQAVKQTVKQAVKPGRQASREQASNTINQAGIIQTKIRILFRTATLLPNLFVYRGTVTRWPLAT